MARGVLALLCTCQGVATLAIDLNRTHATNPEWPRHARFHLVWQTVSTSLLCALEVGLIWWRGLDAELRFYLAAALTCIPLLAFLAALISRKTYGGALSDPNGIPPARISILGKTLHVDLNLVAVVTALLVLAATLGIYRW
jgi:hypothetical protein